MVSHFGIVGSWQPSAIFFVLLSVANFAHAAAGCDGAGNCYVRAGATGAGTGASWTNACPGFSGSCSTTASNARGVTYWVGAGAYSATAFSTPVSGATVTTVEAATALNHGPASDWSASFAGVASFAADSSISTSYWNFNGQTYPSACLGVTCGTSGYPLYFHNTTDSSENGCALILPGGTAGAPITNVSLQYVEVQGISNGTSDDCGIEVGFANNNFYLGHSYVHDVGVDLIQAQYTGIGQNYTGTGWTFEYDYFAHNHRGDASAHAQAIASAAQNLIVRYSVFYDIGSSGCITDPFPGVVALSNWWIYGNTYYWDNTFTAGVGNGLVGLYGETFTGVLYVVNNTIANINNSVCQSGVCNSPAVFVCGTACGSGGTVTAVVENNLWWNPSWGQPVMYDGPSTWTGTEDYNQGYCPSTGCSFGGSFQTGGAHDVKTTTGSPFTSFDGASNFTVTLIADTPAGTPLSSTLPPGCTASVNCLNVDPLGKTRGASGVWDRGAFQYATGTGTLPVPPTSLVTTAQ